MRKKYTIVAVLITLLILSVGYGLLRYKVLATREYAADTTKKESPPDLRPQLIAKLQELVHEGSDGLYQLKVGQITPDVVASTLDITDAALRVDSPGFRRLAAARKLPDDVFACSFKTLHIDGIGIEDLLHKKKIDVRSIMVRAPRISAWHKKQPYNTAERHKTADLSLYQRIARVMDKIVIGKVTLAQGSFTDHDVDNQKVNAFKDISVQLADILVDETTEHAEDRFLFARQATISSRDYSVRTADSLYEFGIGTIAVNGTQHSITARNVSFKPRGTRKEFERRAKTRQEMFTLELPTVTFTGVNWWAMLHRERFVAQTGSISDAVIHIYLNRALPPSGRPLQPDNFPQQLLADIGVPVSFRAFGMRNLKLVYEEYNPKTAQSGQISFERMNGTARNVTNVPAEVRTDGTASFAADALFMGSTPMSGRFDFRLAKLAKGQFTATLNMGAIDHSTINGFAAPLGQIELSGGRVATAATNATGNNGSIQGTLTATYEDLHIAPLKATRDDGGALKKKPVTGLLANMLVKNNNPSGGKLRTETYELDRGQHGNFFNFLWSAIKMGILKLIGIPVKLGM